MTDRSCSRRAAVAGLPQPARSISVLLLSLLLVGPFAYAQDTTLEAPGSLLLPTTRSARRLVPDETEWRSAQHGDQRSSATSEPVSSTESRPGPEPARSTSVAEYALETEIATPLTDNVFLIAGQEFPEYETSVPEPVLVDDASTFAVEEYYSDADAAGFLWSRPKRCVFLPRRLLWEPPLANQREPHMFGKFTNLNDESTIDAAIGATLGLVRLAPQGRSREGFQADIFAAVFTRFNEQRLLVAADYRVGVPFTYRKGPWQAKVSYEHTSTHLGDEFIEAVGRRQAPHVRDEFVFGLARRLCNDNVRAYGQIGYSFLTSNVVGDDRSRFDWGLEWERQRTTTWNGQPFAAFDMDLRSDQDFQPNTTLQIGWQWKRLETGRSARIAFEYYNGKSPYGQFFRDDEDWVGFAGMYDW